MCMPRARGGVLLYSKNLLAVNTVRWCVFGPASSHTLLTFPKENKCLEVIHLEMGGVCELPFFWKCFTDLELFDI